jgi:hypothetical protein
MSVATEYSHVSTDEVNLEPYRALSRSAVVGFVIACIGLVPLALAVYSRLSQFGDAVPVGMLSAVIGIGAASMGFVGWLTIRKYPTEYTGSRLATMALAAGIVQVLLGAAIAVDTHIHEVPEGYERITFYDLQPNPDYPELPVSPKSIEISGQPVFLKGYMHPGVAGTGKVNRFILVNDFGTCCFGGQPKSWHMVEVHVPPGQPGIAYSRMTLKLAGKFGVSPVPTRSLGLDGVFYHLELDQVR